MAHAWLAIGDRALRKAVSVWIYIFSISFLLLCFVGYIYALWRAERGDDDWTRGGIVI